MTRVGAVFHRAQDFPQNDKHLTLALDEQIVKGFWR